MVQAAVAKSRVKPTAPTATAPAEKGFDEPAANNHDENSEEEEYREDDQEVEDEVC